MTPVILGVLMAAISFTAGFVCGRPRTPRFDMKCLPDPHDERWQQIADINCGMCRKWHERRQLGEVVAEKNCGVTVAGIWLGKRTMSYANSVMRVQAERAALASWGEP